MTRRQLLISGGAIFGGGMAAAAVSFTRNGSMQAYAETAAALRRGLAVPSPLRDVLRLATLAANGHNTQPWQFHLGDHRIDILPDFSRRTPVVDPDDHHLFVSLGCAAANLKIAAAAAGHHGEPHFDLAGDGAVIFDYDDGPAGELPLLPAISQRQSTRAEYDGRQISNRDAEALLAASRQPGIEVRLLTEPKQIAAIAELVAFGNTAQLADADFRRELKSWIRFNPRQAMASGDGLFSVASGNPVLPTWLGGLMFDLAYTASGANDKYRRQLTSSAGVAVFISDQNDAEHWMRAGLAAQGFALQATALGLKQAFINQPVEVPTIRQQLVSYLGCGTRRPDLLLRFGVGPELPKSLRRSVSAVIKA
jgi:hypothetical protein